MPYRSCVDINIHTCRCTRPSNSSYIVRKLCSLTQPFYWSYIACPRHLGIPPRLQTTSSMIPQVRKTKPSSGPGAARRAACRGPRQSRGAAGRRRPLPPGRDERRSRGQDAPEPSPKDSGFCLRLSYQSSIRVSRGMTDKKDSRSWTYQATIQDGLTSPDLAEACRTYLHGPSKKVALG